MFLFDMNEKLKPGTVYAVEDLIESLCAQGVDEGADDWVEERESLLRLAHSPCIQTLVSESVAAAELSAWAYGHLDEPQAADVLVDCAAAHIHRSRKEA